MSSFTTLNGVSPSMADSMNGLGDARTSAAMDGMSPPASAVVEGGQLHDATAAGRESTSWNDAGRQSQAFSSTNAYPSTETAQKRKRSWSPDGDREMESSSEKQDGASPRRPAELPEIRDGIMETPRREARSLGIETPQELSRDSWPPRHAQTGHDRSQYESAPMSAMPNSAMSDEPMGDVMMRGLDQDEYGGSSPDEEHSAYPGQFTPEQRRDGLIQSDGKKRKRNFSNRTKTGCLTCRKRKKKCDESKPECSNCVRGGFVCAGYPPQRGQWPHKPENKPPTVQIESKDPSYVPPGAYGMPQPQQQHAVQQTQTTQIYAGQPVMSLSQQKREPLPSYRGQPLRIEPPQGRPVLGDDDRPTASTMPSASVASPDYNKPSALSSAYPSVAGNIFPTPVSAAPVPFPERSGKEYQRVPPLHDLSRTGGEQEQTPQSTTLPQIHVMHAPRTNSPGRHHQQSQQLQTPQSSTAAQATAQLALTHTQQFRSTSPRREKDEMLGQRSYFPFDKELVLERERCSAACWRFNNSTNPNNGVSPMERSRLFREILQPKDGVQMSPTQTSPVTRTGRVGENTVVEAPFVCDYGYNINIGKNVVIGRNCTMVDNCEVKIGDNVIIGPNVSIYTATVTTDFRRRSGTQSPWQGKSITIEDDVFIGGNVIILPGVRIGRGSTVGAGSVVTSSQPAFCVIVGSPAQVKRGVAAVS